MRHARLLVLCAAAVAAACGSVAGKKGIVVPYENGRLVASALARTEQDALRAALAAARDECEGRRQPLAVIKQTTEYKGVVAREVVKTAEQLEKIILEGADKVIPDLSSDEDYKVSLDFRCGS